MIVSFLKTVFFIKNLPNWERVLRIVLALAVVGVAFATLAFPWNWIVAAGGLGFGFSGVVGFCPMCAVFGRRLLKRA
jgi:hypothetical protein